MTYGLEFKFYMACVLLDLGLTFKKWLLRTRCNLNWWLLRWRRGNKLFPLMTVMRLSTNWRTNCPLKWLWRWPSWVLETQRRVMEKAIPPVRISWNVPWALYMEIDATISLWMTSNGLSRDYYPWHHIWDSISPLSYGCPRRGTGTGRDPTDRGRKLICLRLPQQEFHSGIYQDVSADTASREKRNGSIMYSRLVVWKEGPKERKGWFVNNMCLQEKHWAKGSVKMESIAQF